MTIQEKLKEAIEKTCGKLPGINTAIAAYSCAEIVREEALKFIEFDQISPIALAFWKQHFITPKMDGSHHAKFKEENQTTSGNQELTPEKVLRSVDDAFEVHEAITTIEIFGQQRYQQGLKDAEQSKWIPVEERLPPIDEYVLIFYTIKSSFEEDKIHEYTEISRIQFITDYGASKSINWIDHQYNAVQPTHWQPLPSAPDLQEQGKEKNDEQH